jgi:hypothetical protein
MPAKKPKPDEKPQFERFLETVKQVEADDTDDRLEREFEKAVTPSAPRSRPSEKPTHS